MISHSWDGALPIYSPNTAVQGSAEAPPPELVSCFVPVRLEVREEDALTQVLHPGFSLYSSSIREDQLVLIPRKLSSLVSKTMQLTIGGETAVSAANMHVPDCTRAGFLCKSATLLFHLLQNNCPVTGCHNTTKWALLFWKGVRDVEIWSRQY